MGSRFRSFINKLEPREYLSSRDVSSLEKKIVAASIMTTSGLLALTGTVLSIFLMLVSFASTVVSVLTAIALLVLCIIVANISTIMWVVFGTMISWLNKIQDSR